MILYDMHMYVSFVYDLTIHVLVLLYLQIISSSATS